MIVGTGATGVELAAERSRVSQRSHNVSADAQLEIELIEAAQRVMPAASVGRSAKTVSSIYQE